MKPLLRLIVTVLLAAGIVLLAQKLPTPSPADAQKNTSPVTSVVLTCPGSIKKHPAQITVLSAPGTMAEFLQETRGVGWHLLPGKAQSHKLERGQGWNENLAPATSLVLSARGDSAPGLSATQVTSITSGLDAGRASSACASQTGEGYILAGKTDPGRQLFAIAANSGVSTGKVDLSHIDEQGKRTSLISDWDIGAGQRDVLALPPDLRKEDGVLHFQSDNSTITLTIWEQSRAGKVSAGISYASPQTPQKTSLLPGASGGEGHKNTVRLYNPQKNSSIVRISVLNEQGRARADQVVTLAGKEVANIPLATLPDGHYSLLIQADTPVVSGLLAETTGEFAWSAPVPTGTVFGAEIPTGATLVLASADSTSTANSTTITMWSSSPEGNNLRKKALSLNSLGSLSIAIPKKTRVWISSTSPIAAAVSFAKKGDKSKVGQRDILPLLPLPWTRQSS